MRPEQMALPVRECIILAGGLGTRLQQAVPDLPKCLAPVSGKPFLSYIIDYLRMQGVQRFIFSLGYRHEAIEEFLKKNYPTLDYISVIEKEALGTGGAIKLAIQHANENNVVVTNGDTLFKVELDQIFAVHQSNRAECTMALKLMKDFDRYGVVEKDEENRILSFREKRYFEEGTINGGLYILDRNAFMSRELPAKFSFEKDYLENFFAEGRFFGSIQPGYFIDIGIPEDFNKAQTDLKRKPLDLTMVDKSWTLFLDRDGVINDEKLGHYILHWGEFIFSTGVLETFQKLFEKFGRIIVVSNQRGVGKGLMSESDLQSIHLEMQREVEIVGARIDKVYYCTAKEDSNFFRKPNPGMALRAIKEFSSIHPESSIMVGNKPSDMRFGRAAGFYTIFVKTTNPDQPFPHDDIDAVFPSLPDFAHAL